jgi:hypothetical protein
MAHNDASTEPGRVTIQPLQLEIEDEAMVDR